MLSGLEFPQTHSTNRRKQASLATKMRNILINHFRSRPEADEWSPSIADEGSSKWKSKNCERIKMKMKTDADADQTQTKTSPTFNNKLSRSIANNGNWRRPLNDRKLIISALPTLQLLLVTLALLNLCQQAPNEAQALRLPSFLSWIQQPTNGQSTVLANNQHSLAASSSLIGHVIPPGGHREHLAKLKQLDTEPMLGSASMFEASRQMSMSQASAPIVQQQQQQQQQQQALPSTTTARKPFQAMLMMPGKHGHLFSSLPRSLFGRLLSNTGQSTATLPAAKVNPQQQQQQRLQHHQLPAAPANWPNAMPSAVQESLDFNHLHFNQDFNLNEDRQRHQFAQMHHKQQVSAGGASGEHVSSYQQQQQHHHNHKPMHAVDETSGSLRPHEKHALGFGESADFMLDSQNVDESQQHPYNDPTWPNANEAQVEQQQQQQQLATGDKQQSGQQETFEGVPAILISEQEAAAPTGANKQQFVVVGNNSAESVTGDPMPESITNTTMARMESATSSDQQAAQQNVSAVAEAIAELTRSMANENASGSSDGSTAIDSTTSSSVETSTRTNSSEQQQQQQQQPQQISGESSKSTTEQGNVLTSLINDELLKLKQEPETLNKTLASMSEPLAALFLEPGSSTAQPAAKKAGEANESISQPSFENQMMQFKRRPDESHPLESAEAGRLESSAAAIIVAPGSGGGGGEATEQVGLRNNRDEGEEEQFESFIIGPYKGLTSDNLVMSSMNSIVTAEQDQAREPDSLVVNHHYQQQQQQQQHPHQHHHHQQQQQLQSHVGLGVGSMASNLIQQAKSLIHLPFVHHLGSSSGHQSSHPFRGHSSAVSAAARFREQLIEQPSSPYFVMMADQQPHHHSSHLRNRNRNRPSMLRQEQQLLQQAGSLNHYQQRPFYKQLRNNLWPSDPFEHQFNHHPALQAASQQQQHPSQNGNRYFLMPASTMAQQQTSAKLQQRQPPPHRLPLAAQNSRHPQAMQTKQSTVPYFVDSAPSAGAMNHKAQAQQQHQQQQQQVSHSFVPLGQPQQVRNRPNDNAYNLYSVQPSGRPMSSSAARKGANGHPLNNLAADAAQSEAAAYRLLVNHQDHSGAAQQSAGEQPAAEDAAQQAQQQQQQLLSSKPTKFKAGLYQIEPPKLNAEQSNTFEQQQQQQQAAVLGQDDEQDDTQQRQVQPDEQQQQQQQLKTEPDEHDEQDEATNQRGDDAESPPLSDSAGGHEFSRQVGATIGVAPTTFPPATKGRVFNEPLTPTGRFTPISQSSLSDDINQGRSNGKDVSQMKKLKFSQDVTLYDFESPQTESARQAAQSFGDEQAVAAGQQLSLAASKQHAAHQPIAGAPSIMMDRPSEYLDTQVYTVPYTLSVQPNGQMSAAPSFNADHHQLAATSASAQQQQQHLQLANNQQARHLPPFNQIGRFPIPYMAPPSPPLMATSNEVEPAGQAHQFGSTQLFQQPQASFIGLPRHNLPFHHRPDPMKAQSQGANIHYEWSTQQHMLPVSALPMQPGDNQPAAMKQNGFETDTNRQHYFHYQPIASTAASAGAARPTDVEAAQQFPSATNTAAPQPVSNSQDGQQSSQQQQQQQGFEDLTTSKQVSSLPNQQEQYVLAIRHQSDSIAPNGAALFASNFLTSLPQPVFANGTSTNLQALAADNQPTEINKTLQSDVAGSAADQTSSTIGSLQADITTPNEGEDDSDNANASEGNSIRNNNNNASDNGKQSDAARVYSSERQLEQVIRQQLSPPIASTAAPSTPSAFCAEREPGLYADESQRCKAYYQCAPTGHQMFRCNNQTQFNQKTQNCDWWYNVNCGGRLGSPSDFDQAPAGPQATVASESSTERQQNRQQQADRETAASSQQERQLGGTTSGQADATSGSSDSDQRQPEAPRQPNLLGAQDSSFKQQVAMHSNRWSVESPMKSDGTIKQDESEMRADLFHHSESAANITVAPDVIRQQDRQQEQTFQQQQQQQAAPTSSTPIYGRPNVESDTVQQQQQQQQTQTRQDEFSERSSTTRDPLFAQLPTNANEISSGGLVSTELSSTSSLVGTSGESRPQVGAILNGDNDQLAQSLTALVAQDVGSDNSTVGNASDVATTSSTSTISDSTSSNQQATETTTLSMPTSTSSELPSASSAPITDEATTESLGGQLEQNQGADQNNQQASSNKSRRLVQSEFGMGVQQKQLHRESAAKSARSTARFEFIRNPSSLGDALFSGQLTQLQSGARFNNMLNEQQAPNHKYSSQLNTGEPLSRSHQIYSTSANQVSVSYMPLDQQNSSPMSLGKNQDDPLNQQQRATQISSRNKLNRRFGARLQASLAAKQMMPVVDGTGIGAPASGIGSTLR